MKDFKIDSIENEFDSMIEFIDDSEEYDAIENDTRSINHHHSHSSHEKHHEHKHKHHRHHSHSSKRHKAKVNQKRKEAIESFFRHNKKYIALCLMALFILMGLIFIGNRLDKIAPPKTDSESTEETIYNSEQKISHIRIDVPFFSENVSIVSPAVQAFINSDGNTTVSDIYNLYKAQADRLDIGKPIALSYTIDGLPGGCNVKNSEFIVADNKNFENPYILNVEGFETKADIYNLKTDTQYYFCINITFTNDTQTSVSGSFKTDVGPRILNVDGVYNIRDIGAWTTETENIIKQGLLYRGCELDGSSESSYKITQDGINTMLTVLGIKTDMDLRAEAEVTNGTNIFGVAVNHKYYSAAMYSDIFSSDKNAESIRKVFSDLADENNYPVYLHCSNGHDRTGTICYLLESLLGVTEENKMKDYLLSGLHHSDISEETEEMNKFIAALKEYKGATMQEKVENYLISVGVTPNEISRIKNIFLYN